MRTRDIIYIIVKNMNDKKKDASYPNSFFLPDAGVVHLVLTAQILAW